MLPKHQLSTIPQIADWLYPYPTDYSPLIDYEMGGVELNDSSQGLDNTLWKLELNKQTGELKLGKYGEDGEVLLTDKAIKKVSLAFDLNARPAYVLEYDNHVKFTYYDTVTSQNVTVSFDGVRSPYLTLDDRRVENSAGADILLCYIKGQQLCVRYQRDRYTVEHILHDLPHDNYVLERVGMAVNLRVLFALSRLEQVDDDEP